MKRKRASVRNPALALQGTPAATLRPERPYWPFLPPSRSSSASSASEEDSVQVLGLGGLKVGELGKRSTRSFLEHRMMTHAAALAYQGLFALFPFIIFLGVLLVVLQVDDFFEGLSEQARSQPPNRSPGRWDRCLIKYGPHYPRSLWHRR